MTDYEINKLAARYIPKGEFIAFARAIAAVEREACAKVCDDWAFLLIPAAVECAKQIRERGEP